MVDLSLTEKQANIGYLAIGLQDLKGTGTPITGTPIAPDTFVPLYSEDVVININLDEDNPIMGIREARYQSFLGQEDYMGTIKVLAEPKTLPHFLNMILKKGTTTGDATNGYTHPFTLGDTTKNYTIEFLKGNIPFRFWGVEARSITPIFEDNKMVLEVNISALGCFSTRRVISASSTTVVLDDGERPNPTTGLVSTPIGDTLRLYDVSEEAYEDVLISEIADDGKTLTVASISGTYVEGDLCWLKPLTPSYSIVAPFSWGRTEFRFGTTTPVAEAAAQTRVEKGSNWVLIHSFEDDAGAKRSGDFRPAALVRTQGDIEITLKKFFSDGQEQDRFVNLLERALVVKHLSPAHAGSNNTEASLTLTVGAYNIRENTVPLNTGEILYNNFVLAPKYSAADGEMFNIKVVNSLDGSTYN